MHKHINKNAPPITRFIVSKSWAGMGRAITRLLLLLNIEHGTEHDVPLSCISRLTSYLAAGCDIVLIVEREKRNQQVRKDF